MRSKIISEEEMLELAFDHNPETGETTLKPYPELCNAIAKAQRDASDQEWIGWIEQHQWQSQSLIPGITVIKGYLIRDEELQALKWQVSERNEQKKDAKDDK